MYYIKDACTWPPRRMRDWQIFTLLTPYGLCCKLAGAGIEPGTPGLVDQHPNQLRHGGFQLLIHTTGAHSEIYQYFINIKANT